MSASRRAAEIARCAALLVAAPLSAAQPSGTVTDADVQRAQRSQPTITEQDIERARKRHRMPTDAELARVPIPSAPKIDALPAPLAPQRVDLESIARGYDAIAGSNRPLASIGPRLLVFVSFTLPEPTLSRLVEQAARARATLYIRGLVNGSLKETVLRVQRLVGQREVAFHIDPREFDRYAIAVTPSFVLLRDGAQEHECPAGRCVAPDAYVSLAGDVSIEYVLEFVRRNAPHFESEAAFFLRKLKG